MCSRIMCTSTEKQIAAYKWHMSLMSWDSSAKSSIFRFYSSFTDLVCFCLLIFCFHKKARNVLPFFQTHVPVVVFSLFLLLSAALFSSAGLPGSIYSALCLFQQLFFATLTVDCYQLVTCKLIKWDTLFLFQKKPGLSYSKVLFRYLSRNHTELEGF